MNPSHDRVLPVRLAVLLLCVMLLLLTGCMKGAAPAAAPTDAAVPADDEASAKQPFAQLESEYKARLGVYAVDTGTGRTIEYRPDERFAYASTFKALACGAVLKAKPLEGLEDRVTYTSGELVTYSPVTEKHVSTGMTLRELCDAAIRYSDNTAGNLLLKQLGGPKGFEAALKEAGDAVTKAERYETELNEAVPGDDRDTSTPRALASSLRAYTLGDALSADKRDVLTDWLRRNTTGGELIRAAVPEGWVVGDKTGAGSYGTRNDIAVIWPPDGAPPIVMAVLSSRDTKDSAYDNALIAKAAKAALDALKPPGNK
ncbi:class A beta-lactamase [Paenibacillus mucilaginosus]|uniref:Beta-lactamase n=1 Tax=Paenibacillus mucilaginosus (strain KNP414) TaxID=1036673 RepID=F8F5G2_PAEMK|nr:class A beta-lactamase [Paenibacillus mucilaginosus]AEI40973.1 PenP [Paenibacillus mucilaginosus KNP414]MCG7211581.1 class A beta-lactamase [Paenibacillus mucilaginosus]WDM30052.1 class A beta-lactamase [Paenibacillus mucilaginosus]